MTGITAYATRSLIGTAAALSLVAGLVAARPAQAANGDISKGLLLGLATGFVIHQIDKNAAQKRAEAAQLQQWQLQDQAWSGREQRLAHRDWRERRVYYRPVETVPVIPATTSPVSRAFVSQDRQLRISIQYKLMQEGFYNGAIDGLWGPSTRQAVFEYARTHNQVAMLTTVNGSNQVFSSILQ